MMAQALGRIVTFYSYKGGTGRSMALANFAWILAASGKRVLAIDWDLEAPGLHRYFRPFLADSDLFETDGLIDMFWALAGSALQSVHSGDQSTVPENSAAVIEALDDAKRRLDWKFPTGGYIDFVGAGRQGTTYSERVNTFDWRRFYEFGGARLLTALKTHLCSRYEWVLIDSRTGVSDTSGICTMQMPDTVVACFTMNRQSIDGVAAVLRSIRNFRSASVNGSSISLFPVATRIENAEQARLELARSYARPVLADFLPEALRYRAREYWDKMELTYRPSYAFEEVLAAFGDATGATGAADTMLSQVEAMAQRITGDDNLTTPEIVEVDRARVLAKYAFGSMTPLTEKTERVSEGDTADTEFLRNVRAKEQLWRGSGFFWRHLLSRRELDLLTDADRKGFGRNMAYYLANSERMPNFLRWLDFAFAIDLLLGSVAAAAFYYFYPKNEPPAISLVISLYVFMMVNILLALSWSLVTGGSRPYGLPLSQVFRLTLLGPFRRDIADYDPDGK
jgi:cellulose biosynthesis protein BcsQ